ncbi:MAG: LLM class flavin-dependent oxidoreductase [Reinekea sp.]|nr:LLM class flavin-dependent oxidoreductase [Reinekea sp.]
MTTIEQKLRELSPEKRKALLEKAKRAKAKKETEAGFLPSESLTEVGMDFSLIFFSGNGSTEDPGKYDLLIEAAKFADEAGFSAIITPERHLQPVGGLFPNPSVLNAALAMVTKNIQLRAGSVVIPLHNPIRVAEEWSVVDNLSGGRAAISLATGWHPADFILAPESFENRRDILFKNVEMIQKLWAGESVPMNDITGNAVDVVTLPRPVQRQLPMFLTSSGNPETWKKAGQMGLNVLCSLANHSVEDLVKYIAMYREQRKANGFDPDAGVVSTMVHAYVGESDEAVKSLVKEPLRDFLNGYINQNDTLNPFKDKNKEVRDVIDKDREALISYAFEKHFSQTSLMGSKEKCAKMVQRLHDAGVNEIACLVDFGLPQSEVMAGLQPLADLKAVFAKKNNSAKSEVL